jgi:hypothetical protein
VSGGLPGWISRLATFTWLVSLSAQLTVATTIGLLGMIGAMAVTVPHAKCPLLVGGRVETTADHQNLQKVFLRSYGDD